ncbi:MAG TPA: type II secretion system protein GspG [Treponema sp.]|jgi:general secretion pathway protein G|nr:type II secretion system major pseudopilin GspG [Treponema sp.]MBO5608727.1 type II secretion system major pseudopilin GspG [Treponema sp.]HBB42883.1 type II secretion system protein GspG [Treponema sp.]HCA19822.1 type II secretion system protein GspG [Treponema sp.]
MKINLKKKRKEKDEGNGGFTFVETLAVLAVGAVLTAGATVSVFKTMEVAREYSARETIAQYKAALNSYYIDCGTYPSSEQGLSALWQKPDLVPVPSGWHGPYLDKEVQQDPWGGDFVYIRKDSARFPSECPENLPYVIYSYGPDHCEGGVNENADIVSWR